MESGGGGRGTNYGTISRQQLAQLAATPGGLDGARSLSARLLLLVAPPLFSVAFNAF